MAYAGKLDEFEKDVTSGGNKEPEKDKGEEVKVEGGDSGGESVPSEFEDDVAETFGEIFAKLLFYSMGYFGMMSLERVNPGVFDDEAVTDEVVSPDPASPTEEPFIPGVTAPFPPPDNIFKLKERRPGEALIPLIRLDSGYQDVESDVEAYDFRLEAGYAFFAAEARLTHYIEEAPDDSMDVWQGYLVYRMSFTNIFELNLGAGAMGIEGDEKNYGFSFSASLLAHPLDYVGVEIRSAWASINENHITDVEAALLLGWRYASVKVGYRKFESENVSLNGPVFGVAIRY